MLKGPVALEYHTDLWTTRRVAEVIRKSFVCILKMQLFFGNLVASVMTFRVCTVRHKISGNSVNFFVDSLDEKRIQFNFFIQFLPGFPNLLPKRVMAFNYKIKFTLYIFKQNFKMIFLYSVSLLMETII